MKEAKSKRVYCCLFSSLTSNIKSFSSWLLFLFRLRLFLYLHYLLLCRLSSIIIIITFIIIFIILCFFFSPSHRFIPASSRTVNFLLKSVNVASLPNKMLNNTGKHLAKIHTSCLSHYHNLFSDAYWTKSNYWNYHHQVFHYGVDKGRKSDIKMYCKMYCWEVIIYLHRLCRVKIIMHIRMYNISW